MLRSMTKHTRQHDASSRLSNLTLWIQEFAGRVLCSRSGAGPHGGTKPKNESGIWGARMQIELRGR